MGNIDLIKKFAKNNGVPIILEDGLNFILDYIKKNKVKTILEVGSAIGFSSIMMASLYEDIYIDTLEIDEERYKQALINIRDFNLEERINIYLIDAMAFETHKRYDLIFIDAAKAQYKKYMLRFLENLSVNGVFIFDNMNFHGLVDSPELTKNRNTKSLVRKIKNFRDEILNSEAYQVDFYKDIGDGILLVRKK